jgi:hypothetical protein
MSCILANTHTHPASLWTSRFKAPFKGCVCVCAIQSGPPVASHFEELVLMGQVVCLSQHQATKQMQIREAERKAQDALLQASAAFKELHRLKSD